MVFLSFLSIRIPVFLNFLRISLAVDNFILSFFAVLVRESFSSMTELTKMCLFYVNEGIP